MKKKKNVMSKEDKLMNFFSKIYLTFLVYAFIGWIYEVLWFIVVRHKFVNRGFLNGPYLPVYGFGMLILLFLLKKFLNKKHDFFDFKSCYLSFLWIFIFLFISIIEYTTFKIYKISVFFNVYGKFFFIYLLFSLLFVFLIRKFINKNVQKKIKLSLILVSLLIFIITTMVEFSAHLLLDKYFGIILWDYSKDFLNFNSRICWDASRNFAIGGTFLIYVVQPFIDKLFVVLNKNVKYILSLVLFFIMIVDLVVTLLW